MTLTKQNGQRSHDKNECATGARARIMHDRARAAWRAFEFKLELSAVVTKINFTRRWFTSLGASVYESPSQDPPPAFET